MYASLRELLPGFLGSPGAIPGTGIVIKRQGGLCVSLPGDKSSSIWLVGEAAFSVLLVGGPPWRQKHVTKPALTGRWLHEQRGRHQPDPMDGPRLLWSQKGLSHPPIPSIYIDMYICMILVRVLFGLFYTIF